MLLQHVGEDLQGKALLLSGLLAPLVRVHLGVGQGGGGETDRHRRVGQERFGPMRSDRPESSECYREEITASRSRPNDSERCAQSRLNDPIRSIR
ncbi:hypothetical protein EYF80_056449 [Liparis tanakae]|uniref:Uncharacterized protein n=1 Tax=Liparis tanakae TaxID=230148 RepID=A0A4Z2EX56_9TELE|nr:hypothetical protein EYF80_056449 [Liparis tanakae]